MLPNLSARIVGHSVNPSGVALCSWVLRYPRMIHAELMTYRVFSRNAASSRAIPLKKMIRLVEENPARFEYWGSNQPGMQAGASLSASQIGECDSIIQDLRNAAINAVSQLDTIGLHKQNANRYLEPFGHITTLVTACEWENFFAQRVHKDAQPEFMKLAALMAKEWLESVPRLIDWGGWHMPIFNDQDETFAWGLNPKDERIADRLKVATARCARLSYLTFDGTHDPAKDIELHDNLARSGHWSPFEHCAQAHRNKRYPWSNFDQPELVDDALGETITGLSHWKQYRKLFPEERQTISKAELRARLIELPDWAKP